MLTLTPVQAGAVVQHGRRLLQRKQLTPYQYALLDALVWRARRPGHARLMISFRVLAKLLGQARSTVVEGIEALERMRLIRKMKQRIRVPWLGGTASRQAANAYEILAPDTGSAGRPVRDQSPEYTTTVVPPAIERALEKLARSLRVEITQPQRVAKGPFD